MFGMGMPEIILILAIALIVIGPKKLPDLAKSLGRAMGEFKRATTEFKESVDFESNLKSVRNSLDDMGTDNRTDAVSSSKESAPDANQPEKTGLPESDLESDLESESKSDAPSETSPKDPDEGIKSPESGQTDKQAEKKTPNGNRE